MKFDVPEIPGNPVVVAQPIAIVQPITIAQPLMQPYGTHGQYGSIQASVASPGNVILLPVAPSGFSYHIGWISLWAPTTAYTPTASVHIRDLATNYDFVWCYTAAEGVQFNGQADFYMAGPIQLVNSSGVTATATLIYRQEPFL